MSASVNMINAILMICVVFVTATLCQSWILPPDGENWYSLTSEQKEFETWLIIEFLLILSYIGSAMIYIAIAKVKQPCLLLLSPTVKL